MKYNGYRCERCKTKLNKTSRRGKWRVVFLPGSEGKQFRLGSWMHFCDGQPHDIIIDRKLQKLMKARRDRANGK